MSKRIEFDPPEDFSIPEGKTSGDDFDIVATIRIKPDGRLCLVALDGARMPGYTDGDDKSYPDAVAERMDREEL